MFQLDFCTHYHAFPWHILWVFDGICQSWWCRIGGGEHPLTSDDGWKQNAIPWGLTQHHLRWKDFAFGSLSFIDCLSIINDLNVRKCCTIICLSKVLFGELLRLNFYALPLLKGLPCPLQKQKDGKLVDLHRFTTSSW